jgi:pyochelin synthetase
MNLTDLLQQLSSAGIQVRADGDEIEIRAPKGSLTAPLRNELARQKPAILAWIHEHASAGVALPAIEPDPAHRYHPFPLTDIQQAYWVGRSGMLDLGAVATHFYVELESEDVDPGRLAAAWRRVVGRHDMLRAIVLPEGRQQILAEVPPYEIALVDLSGASAAEAQSTLETVRREMSHQVLDAARWPLFDIRVTRLAARRSRLHISLDLLICDLDSMLRLFEEWARYYNDPAPAAPRPDLSFRDYVIAERDLRQSPAFQKARDYWLARLDTLPPAPQLPLARNPQSVGRHRFVRRQSHLPAARWSRLKQRAAQAGLTPSGVLLAAYAEILGSWSKSPRFTLNLTVFNRLPLHAQVQDIVGDFTCVSLLDVDVSQRESFPSLAARLRQQLWRDLEHRLFSGVNVLRELARREGGYREVMMPVVFTSALSPAASGQDAGVFSRLGETVYSISQTPQVWLDHQVLERAGDLVFNWDAVEELFPEHLLDDMFGAYCGLLESLASKEEAWTAPSRALVPPSHLADRALANATGAPISGRLLHEAFLRQAEAHPNAVAVIAAGRTLTYGEVAGRAAALARRLRELSVGPNMLVAIVMEKGWEQVVAAVAVLIAQAAYVPIDPDLPAERRRHLMEASEISIALTQSSLDRSLEWPALEWPAKLTRIVVDQLAADAAPPQPAPVQSPEDLAYVIYTSGSSGLPKGVAIDHRGAVNTIEDINRRFQVGPRDRVLSLSSLSFDLSVYDIFGLLSAGGAVVLPDPSLAKEPRHWLDLAERHGVTVWNTVPALMQMAADYSAAFGGRLPASLRLALLSGDWIPLALPDEIRGLSGGIEIVSLGGATEASIWSIFHPIGAIDPEWKSIPYGRPLANQTFQVLNQRLEPCPIWVPGDLYIGGIGLAQGYWHDAARTAASFLVHPATGERLYKTGDLGRYLPGGIIEFLGRDDFQVKINGFRIELGEIEAALRQHPDVREMVAVAAGPAREHQQLAAYVVPARPIEPAALREYLRRKLPEYMIPVRFISLGSLPLTANGKVDRRALPPPNAPDAPDAPDKDGASNMRAVAQPASPIEERIAGIWREVLQRPRVLAHDNFFALGGDSVMAIRIMSRIREVFSVELPLRHLFETPTPAGLADAIAARQMAEAGPDEMAQILATLEQLSEEEAGKLL